LPELFLPSLDKISQPPSFDDDLSDVAKKLWAIDDDVQETSSPHYPMFVFF
jgi:hypothetical protein